MPAKPSLAGFFLTFGVLVANMKKTSFSKPMRVMILEMLDFPGMGSLSHFPNLLYLVEVLALLILSKYLFGAVHRFSLEDQLVKEDNKAVTIYFTAFVGSVALILEGVLEGPSAGLLIGMLDLALWAFIGIALLLVAGWLNDRFILRGIDAKVEMLGKGNLAVTMVGAGSLVGSAAMIRAIVTGESLGWGLDIGLTLFYFVLGQLSFWVYALIYQKITAYDDLAEIQSGNVAAGITLGMNLGAMGFLMSVPLSQSYSLLWYLAWFVVGNATLLGFRFVMDVGLIPTQKLDQEIHQDQNWGIAFLEGGFSVVAVLILQNIFG